MWFLHGNKDKITTAKTIVAELHGFKFSHLSETVSFLFWLKKNLHGNTTVVLVFPRKLSSFAWMSICLPEALVYTLYIVLLVHINTFSFYVCLSLSLDSHSHSNALMFNLKLPFYRFLCNLILLLFVSYEILTEQNNYMRWMIDKLSWNSDCSDFIIYRMGFDIYV